MSDPLNLGEAARAVEETAKTAGKAVDAIRELGKFLARYAGSSLEQAVGIVEDKLAFYRWANQIKLMRRAKELLTEEGLQEPSKQIPLRLAIPLLEGASLEDDPELQERWAQLLVNSTNSNSGLELRHAYISILKELGRLEVQILQRIYSLPFEDSKHRGVFTFGLPQEASIATRFNKEAGEPGEEVQLALANLVRLGCLSFGHSWGGGEVVKVVTPTFLGKNFVAACSSGSRAF